MERHSLVQKLILCGLSFVCVWTFAASAQDIRNRMLTIWPGELRGKANTVFIDDRYAFVGVQANYTYDVGANGTVVFDISNAGHPRRVGALSGFWLRALSGRYWFEYLPADGSMRLQDIADPLEPAPIWTKQDTFYQRWVADGFYGFGSDGTNLFSFDVTDFSQPTNLGELSLPTAPQQLLLFGNLLVAVDWSKSPQVVTYLFIDVNNPALPKLQGRYDVANAYRITVNGGRAYIATQELMHDYVIKTLDVSDFSNIKTIGDFGFGGQFAAALSAYDKLLIVSDAVRGLLIFDVTDPNHFLPVSVWPAEGCGHHFRKGNLLYFTTLYGLETLDITSPVAPRQVSSVSVSTGDASLAVYVAGARAFVADYYSDLKVLDVANPADPKLIGKYPLSRAVVEGIEVNAHSAYVLSSNIYQLDLSQVGDPSLISITVINGGGTSLAKSTNSLIVGRSDGVIQLFDVTEGRPVQRGSISFTGQVERVVVRGNLAFAAIGDELQGGLLAAIDISNPDQPRVLSTITNVGYSGQVAINGPAICVATDSGVRIYQLDRGNKLQTAGEVILSNTPVSMVTGPGNTVCVLSLQYSDFAMIDVANPRMPSVVNRWQGLPVNLGRLAVDTDRQIAYVAGEDFGFFAIDLSPNPAQPTLHAMVDGETHLIRWASDDDHLQLMHSSTLTGPWEPVATNRIASGLFRTATIPSRTAGEFYRLQK